MKSDSRTHTWIRLALLVAAVLVAYSCTRMPTAPRIPVVVEGRISGPSGEPLEDVVVSFSSDDDIWLGFEHATTDSLGLYTVDLAAGKYHVDVYPPASLPTPTHRARVTFSTSRSRYDFGFKGFRVTGHVTDPTGEPIDSGYVSAYLQGSYDGGARTSLTNGNYSLLLPAGTYSLSARDANGWSGFPHRTIAGVSVTADTTVIIQLEGFLVSGTVSGPDGLPMEDVGVQADYAAGNVTKADGSYRLYVPPGTYRLFFRPSFPYYIFPRVSDPVTITGPTSIDCDLAGVEWAGTVRRLGTGDPVPDVILTVTQVDDLLWRRATLQSDAQGGFRFILEPERSYDVRAYDPGAGRTTYPLRGVAAAADTTFEIFIP